MSGGTGRVRGWPWLGDAEPRPDLSSYRPAIGRHGMVCSPHHLASQAGLDVLRAGGNAIDAAIATSAALMVTCPMQCGPGGDAVWLVREPSGAVQMLDATGRSPRLASSRSLRDAGHLQIPRRSAASVTVPGAVAGWSAAAARYGSKPLADLLEPAARLAEDGIAVSRHLLASFLTAEPALREHGALLMWRADGVLPGLYDILRQPALARTLREIGRTGGEALYRGRLAEAVVAACQRAGGWLSAADLAEHDVDWVAPLRSRYRDAEVFACAPSSQGFVLLVALRILETLAPARVDPCDGAVVHLMIEALAMALRERDRCLADRRSCDSAIARLLQESTIGGLAREVHCDLAGKRETPAVRQVTKADTANLVVADGVGMLVSLTQSLFFDFGSGIPVPEGGFTLHNRGAAFSLTPGAPAELAPGLRPPHTLMPTLVTTSDGTGIAMGCMGGDGQPQTQMQLILDLVDGGLDPQQAISRPRWYLDRAELPLSPVLVEAGVASPVVDALAARQHQVIRLGASEEIMGHAQAIVRRPDGVLIGAADPRSDGQAATY